MLRIFPRRVPEPRPGELALFAQKALTLAALAAALYVAWLALPVLTLVAVSALAAAALAPAVDALERRRVPAWLAISCLYLGLAAFAALVTFAVVPLVADSLGRLLGLADGWLKSLQAWSAAAPAGGTRDWARQAAAQLSTYNVLPLLRDQLAGLSSGVAVALGTGWGIVSATVSAVASALLAAVLCFIILLERRAVWEVLLSALPARAASYLESRGPRLGHIVTGWLRGQAVVGMAVALIVYAGLWCLEPFGLSFDSKANLALVAGMLIVLPYVGFAVALLPALAFALSMGGWGPLLGIAAVYGATQLLESNLVTPYVMGRSLDVSPLLTLCTLLVMASLLGIPGALLAAPASAVIALLYHDFRAARGFAKTPAMA